MRSRAADGERGACCNGERGPERRAAPGMGTNVHESGGLGTLPRAARRGSACDHGASTHRGVAGFHPSNSGKAVSCSGTPWPDSACCRTAGQRAGALLNSLRFLNQAQDTSEALAAEIGAEIGEPCTKCGCTLYYCSGEYKMCYWCLPRPAKFGRVSDEQRARLWALYAYKVWEADKR